MVYIVKSIQQMINKAVLLFLLWFVLSGCQLTSSSAPPTLVPYIPTHTSSPTSTLTPTAGVITLPLIMQAEPKVSPTPEMVSTSTFTPTGTVLPGATPTIEPASQITLLFTGVIVPARCVQSAIDARGDAEYIYDEVRETISKCRPGGGDVEYQPKRPIHPYRLYRDLCVGERFTQRFSSCQRWF